MIADDSLRRGEPPLSALCLKSDETAGDGYKYVVTILRVPTTRTT